MDSHSVNAYQLSLRDARVTVGDAGSPGMTASNTSYTWINAPPKPPRERRPRHL